MLKKKITYQDFDDTEQTQTFYFNLTKAELIELELTESSAGGLRKKLISIGETEDGQQIIEIFKEIVSMSIGEKTPDGQRFVKNAEIREGFLASNAYSEMFMEILSDSAKAAAFITGILPKDLLQEMKADIKVDQVMKADVGNAPSVPSEGRQMETKELFADLSDAQREEFRAALDE